MYYSDRFQKPYPFKADLVVSIDSVMEKKLDALDVIESQFLEGGANGDESLLPKTPEQRAKRAKDVRNGMAARNRGTADRYRKELATWYPQDQAQKVKYAEAFEICEYGRQPSKDELKKLFPFFSTP